MTILEAFGTARPVVTTDLGGLPELVTDGETGRLVPPDDAAALAATPRPDGRPGARAPPGLRGPGCRAATRFGVDTHLTALGEVYAQARQHHEEN